MCCCDAVSRDVRLRARIAGTGPLAGSLQARCSELGIADRVELLGPIPPDEVEGFYRTLDVLAVPSMPTSRWTEQFGRVAVEAMACGIPVVASDAGALPDVVGGAGIVVPPGDAAALAARWSRRVARGGPNSQELGLRRAAECSWDAVGARLPRPLPQRGAHRDIRAPIAASRSSSSRTARPTCCAEALAPVVGLPVTVVDNSSLPEIAALCAELGVRYIDAGRQRRLRGGRQHRARRSPRARRRRAAAQSRRRDLARPDRGAARAGCARSPTWRASGPVQVDEAGEPAQVEWPFPHPARLVARGARARAALQRGARFVIGSVLLLRAEALDQVGGFDERFFLYAEETDWAYRAHRLGWRHASRGGGARRAPRCRHQRRLAADAKRTSTPRRSATCASTSARSAGSPPAPAVWIGAMLRVDRAPRGERGTRRAPPRGALPARADAGRAPPHRRSGHADAHRADRAVHRRRQRRRRRGVEPRPRVPRCSVRTVETFTFGMARRGRSGPRGRSARSRSSDRTRLAHRVVQHRRHGARATVPRRAPGRDLHLPQQRARGRHLRQSRRSRAPRCRRAGRRSWRICRNPFHVFTYLRDRYPVPRSHPPRGGRALHGARTTALRDTYGRVRAAGRRHPERRRPRAVPPAHARTSGPRRATCFRLDDDDRVALFVGHEFERKGLAFAIEALLHAPTVHAARRRRHGRDHRRGLRAGGSARRRRASAVRRAAPRPARRSSRHPTCSCCRAPTRRTRSSCSRPSRAGCRSSRPASGFAPEIIVDGVNGFLVDRDAREVGERLEQIADRGPGRRGVSAPGQRRALRVAQDRGPVPRTRRDRLRPDLAKS